MTATIFIQHGYSPVPDIPAPNIAIPVRPGHRAARSEDPLLELSRPRAPPAPLCKILIQKDDHWYGTGALARRAMACHKSRFASTPARKESKVGAPQYRSRNVIS